MTSMGNVAVNSEFVLLGRRRRELAAALAVAAMLVGPAPLGHAAPAPAPQPPVPVINGHHPRAPSRPSQRHRTAPPLAPAVLGPGRRQPRDVLRAGW